MRQGSILAFLQPQTNTPGPKEPHSTVTVTPIPGRSKPSSEYQTELSDGSEGPLHDEARTPHHSDSPSELVHTLPDPRAAIMMVLPSHVDRLKSITATLLPVRYSDKFFTECLEPETYSVISFVALYDSQPVGWIRCRVEPFPCPQKEVYQQIYIQALGILAPFRGLGLAVELLKAVMATAQSTHSMVRSIYAHVWEWNGDALAWYDKQDFRRIMLQQQYYRRLKPSGAWVVRKELE